MLSEGEGLLEEVEVDVTLGEWGRQGRENRYTCSDFM